MIGREPVFSLWYGRRREKCVKILTFVGTCKRGIWLFPLVCTVEAVHLRGSIARGVKKRRILVRNAETTRKQHHMGHHMGCLLIVPRFHVTVSAHCIAQEACNVVQVTWLCVYASSPKLPGLGATNTVTFPLQYPPCWVNFACREATVFWPPYLEDGRKKPPCLRRTYSASLLGLLAKIKCSICSYQLNIWYAAHWAAHILNWFLELGCGKEACLVPATGCLGIALPPSAAHFPSGKKYST